jgi:hypothetical protein
VCRFEINSTSPLSHHTCSRTSPLRKKDTLSSDILFFLHFPHFKSHWSPTIHDVNIRCGPVSWPPSSPDITPLHFLLGWGYEVLRFQNICGWHWNLRARIIEAIQNVVKRMLTRTWAELDNRLDVIMGTKYSHIDVIWSTNTPFELQTLFKRLHVSVCFGFDIIVLKYTLWLLWTLYKRLRAINNF